MKPLEMTLEGFIGVRSGLGKDAITLDLRTIPEAASVVAIVGPNGTSKTTILDNLHPYRIMPSHASTISVGSFSYWDHICGTSAKKVLLWEHGGRQYQSVLAFRSTGKTKKVDCYLMVQNESTQCFEPVTLPDGTTSDGKTDTYDKCVTSILGAPETFFMSMFSAQSKKSLASYGASEIKALLASILEQSDLRVLAEKANLVGKLLRFELEKLQDDVAQSRTAAKQIEEVKAELAIIDTALGACNTDEQARLADLDAARKVLTLIEAKRDSVAQDIEQRNYLNAQREKACATAQSLREKTTAESDAEKRRLQAEKVRAEQELTAAKTALENLVKETGKLESIVKQKDEIQQACASLPNYRSRIAELDAEMQTAQAKLATLRVVQKKLLADTAELSRTETSGKTKAEIIDTLKETAAQIDLAPCKGRPMQAKCPLLENAHVARAGVEKQEKALVDMRAQYRVVLQRVEAAQKELKELPALEAVVAERTKERNELSNRCDAASRLCGMASMVEDATQRLLALATDRESLQQRIGECGERVTDFATQLVAIDQKREVALAEIDANASKEVAELDERLAKLAQPVSETDLETARQAVTVATTKLDAVRAQVHAHREKRNELCGKTQVLANLQAQAASSVKQAGCLTDEIAKWKILEKGLGTNGLIALMIDDAGPEIATLCNELLEENYGGRFMVRLETQRETATGNLKEDFDVVVTDTHRGEDKSLGFMSGGEKVWVNECLHRAIALYVGQSSGKQYHTLFSDETDGALDPERKRQHFQMKRSVLAKGGYQREYFITQTPEIWEMADHIIDVTAL